MTALRPASAPLLPAALAILFFVVSADAATLEQRCSAAKLKAISKRISGDLKCESKALLQNLSRPDPTCLQKSEDRFSDALADAEAQTLCEGDGRTLLINVESCIENVVAPISPIVVPVHMHVIHNGNTAPNLSDATIAVQMEVLNEAFGGYLGGAATAFQFELVSVDRTLDAAWYNMDYGSNEEEAAKAALRQGDATHLNIYTANIGDGLLGWSTAPSSYSARPQDDGVVLLYSTVPGGAAAPYHRGKTLVREVGIWLGLRLPSLGGCNAGDSVADTPPEASPAFGCPVDRDTCPGDSQYDAIHNFMDYTDDDCLYEFTAGQAERMQQQWSTYRLGEVTPAPDE
ncbi:MAG TPA: zinc metalloprotease [Candidatus Binatia bacterium]|nr:zinc metalloprotease [Candidatus Binatia bacterium]